MASRSKEDLYMASLERKISSVGNEINSVKKEIEDLKNKINSVEEEIDDLKDEIKAVKEKIKTCSEAEERKQLCDRELRLLDKENRLSDKEKQLRDKEKQLRDKEKQLRNQLREEQMQLNIRSVKKRKMNVASCSPLEIQHLQDAAERKALEIYIKRGSQLVESVDDISQNLLKVIKSDNSKEPMPFFFVEASSGMGKSQLAESLKIPVVYIPLVSNQLIYQCFEELSACISNTLVLDQQMLKDNGYMHTLRSGALKSLPLKFHTVGLLFALFEDVCGRSNEESIKYLSGYDSSTSIYFSPMTLRSAECEIKELLKKNTNDLIPVFMIDEVPSSENKEQYDTCILLRNFIRYMRCVCLLSGTEAAAINAIDSIPMGSRGNSTFEYVRLIVKLPGTKWNIFQNDPKYRALIESLAPNVVDMLKRTRPLFVQYMLDALLVKDQSADESSSRFSSSAVSRTTPLTCAALSTVKAEILSQKKQFTSDGGLYAQLALLHSDFIAHTVDEISKHHTNTESQHISWLTLEKQFCIRHHFGALRTDSTILSLFLDMDDSVGIKEKVNGHLQVFEPNVVFASPSVDPLLYLICFRNGIHRNHKRVSTSSGLYFIYQQRLKRNSPLFLNTKQASSSGKYLEMEMTSAAIIASHSYPHGLFGCPLGFFLCSMVAELNVAASYVSHDCFTLLDMPPRYGAVMFGLLSPANAKWREDESYSDGEVQPNGIMLCDFTWSANIEQNDGFFPAAYGSRKVSVSMEAKCYQDKVPTKELSKTIENNKQQEDNKITIMVVTNFSKIKKDNKNFNNAKEGCNVFKITGNAGEALPVATELRWEPIHEEPLIMKTVLVIVLESIYHGRYAHMNSIYHSTT
eukprot:CAMPEP_0170093994 /NCGR_PEP_ID=MMETSP0019_2-20121128/26891_1 /TAXON_ID=98059 /ORGANISM="Dinobryon sp., Strain UTEXLB2267" /LENGTH=859 /DNA_ID=CAMNT_0010315039 /DNA_START=129 /DNA_END=2708 /DNA_ORIENTATION=-